MRDLAISRFAFVFNFYYTYAGETIYTIVGWDMPDDTMRTNGINEKMYGFYDTSKAAYTDNTGVVHEYPLLISNGYSIENDYETIADTTFWKTH